MATSATIILTGIAYLLLTPDPSKDPTDLRVAILRQDKAVKNKHGNPVPRHVPFILINQDDVDTALSKRVPDYTLTKTGKAGTHLLYVLDKEMLTVANVTSTKLEVPTTASTDREPFRDHVPDVKTFCPSCARLTEADLKTPKFAEGVIAATLHVDKGSIAAHKRAIDCEWDFDQEGSFPDPGPMQLTQEVTIDFKVDPQLVLKSTKGAGANDITFKSGKAVEVMIGSAPLEDILLVDPPDHAMTDQHFGLYYKLVEPKLKTTHPLPNKDMSTCRSTIQQRLGGANCPPVVQW